MTSFRATPISNDITKIVRNHYKPPAAKPYKFTKVWNRTDTNLLEERPDTLWERHYVRRHENLHKGFHSIPWEPYQDIGGEVVLDPYNLVLKTLSKNLDEKVWSAPHKQFYDDKPKDWKKKTVLPAIKPKDQEPVEAELLTSATEVLEPVPPVNGYKKIMEKLAEDAKVTKCVQSGQSYEAYVRLQQELQQQEEDESRQDNDMVLMSLTDLQLGLVHITDSDSEYDDDDDDDDDIRSIDQEHGIPQGSSICPAVRIMSQIRKSLALPLDIDFEQFTQSSLDPLEEGDSVGNLSEKTTSLNPLIKISSGITEKKERIRRDHLQFLECLNTVIVSLHNMKGRDLKSKNPLSLETVKSIQKFYNPPHLPPVNGGERESKLNYLGIGRFQSKLQKFSTTTVASSTDGHHSKSSDGQTQPKKVTIQESTPSATPSSNPAVPKMPFGGKRKSIRVPMEAVLHAIQEKKRPVVETWEDLLNLPGNERSRTPIMGMHANIIVKAMQWHKKLSTNTSGTSNTQSAQAARDHHEEPVSQYAMDKKEQAHVKKQPIWQLVASEKYPKTTKSKKKKTTKEVGNLAYINRKKLYKLRSTVQQELETSLQKIEREKMVSFKMKYELFDNLSPLFEEHLINMRRSKTNMVRNVDVLHVPPSKWYDELREKTYSITGQNDMEINDVLHKLSKFSTMDTKTVFQAKAKLCLLVMSLPAYSILTISMQKAIKYVLETILLGELSMLVDWLGHRKMPLVLDLGAESEEENAEDNTQIPDINEQA